MGHFCAITSPKSGSLSGERSLIGERVVMGIKRARSQGKTLGRPAVFVDPDIVRSLKAQGLSLRAIAERVGLSHTKVAQVLK